MRNLILLGFDLGASSGRAIIGKLDLDNKRLEIEEIYRFPNGPIRIGKNMYWDILMIWKEMKSAILLAYKKYKEDLVSIGVDTWGVDFGLLDNNGELIGFPHSYRDPRNKEAMDELLSRIPKEKIYMRTGIQFTPINTLYQLYAMVRINSTQLKAAKTFLMIPDIFNYWLSGVTASEFTEASTTQFLDPRTKTWTYDLLEEIGIPTNIFPEIIEPGTYLDKIDKKLAEELGISKDIAIIAPATHDTASAIAAAPIEEDYGYVSCGTWSLVGIELDRPLINKKSMEYNFTNEGGAFNTITFLRNIQGMWFLQEIRRALALKGENYSYEELTKMAAEARGFIAFIDPDNPKFLSPINMIDEIMKFLDETKQEKPRNIGELVRIVLESLALKYRRVFEQAQDLTGRKIRQINIFGGGSRNWLHNQLVADFTNIPVVAGPTEATSIGNILLQTAGLGYINSLKELREIVRNSFELSRYEPNHTPKHEDAYQRFLDILEKTGGI
ncbi:MAG: rhamnulokinase [Staphylothermus sp.]|nr:rhamnulokinase [Staphylothermus sp.]